MEVRRGLDAGSSELRVDTHSLTLFGAFMQHELNENIAPMSGRLRPALDNGSVVAPRLSSGDVEALNSRHVDCISAMTTQLAVYVTNMAIVADAARLIASRYTSSDTLAGATINDIVPAYNQAVVNDTPAPPSTSHGAAI
jgi:hypothetical protein